LGQFDRMMITPMFYLIGVASSRFLGVTPQSVCG
jgi:hypothetical protein